VQTVAIVLNVDPEKADAFEAAFREHELPIWEDFHGRGSMLTATLSRMDISSVPTEGAVQYLIAVIFADDQGHHEHDNDARFAAWNEMADAYQVAEALALGGDTVVSIGAE
jgi:quinol monooxygenase YgiN